MFAGEAHCPALRFTLLARRFVLDAHMVEENVMDVFRFLWGSMIEF